MSAADEKDLHAAMEGLRTQLRHLVDHREEVASPDRGNLHSDVLLALCNSVVAIDHQLADIDHKLDMLLDPLRR